MHAEQSLADFLDSKWTQRVARLAMMVLGFFVPIGGMAIGYMVNDSRAKAVLAERAAGDMLDQVGDIKVSLSGVEASINGLQSDLSALKLSAARTAGIVEQMQLQSRPASLGWKADLAAP